MAGFLSYSILLRFVGCFILCCKLINYYSTTPNGTEIPTILIPQMYNMLDYVKAGVISSSCVRAWVLIMITATCVTIIIVGIRCPISHHSYYQS